jgi:ABC-type sugar transport system substrate-binding protein
MKNLKVSATIAVAAVAGLALSGCATGADGGASNGGGDEIVVGISLDKIVAFREGEIKYLDQAAEELGVTLIYQNAEEDAQRQSSQIETLISQGAQGIAVMPFDPEAIRADIVAAQDAGVIVTSFDQAPADLSWVSYYVGGDPLADGLAAAAEFVRIADGEPFTLLELQGALNSDNGIKRSQGLHDGLEGHDNITIVGQVPTDWAPEPALAGIENALQQYPDLDGIYLPTDGQIPSAFSALEAVDRLFKVGEEGHVAIVSIDGDPVGCQALKDGYVDMVLATDVPTMTRNVLVQTIAGIRGETMAESELLPGIAVTPENIADNAPNVWGCAE